MVGTWGQVGFLPSLLGVGRSETNWVSNRLTVTGHHHTPSCLSLVRAVVTIEDCGKGFQILHSLVMLERAWAKGGKRLLARREVWGHKERLFGRGLNSNDREMGRVVRGGLVGRRENVQMEEKKKLLGE